MQETQTAIRKRTITPVLSFIVVFYDLEERYVREEHWKATIPDMLWEVYHKLRHPGGEKIAGANIRSEYGTYELQVGIVPIEVQP